MDSPLITAHDLRLLSVGYYIQAGIGAFYVLALLGYSAFVGTILTTLAKTGDSAQHIPPFVLSIISIILAVVIGLVCAYTACLFLAAYWLLRLRNLLFIQIVAGVSCLSIPYGTVLGIFTFMVLQRPSAKQSFAGPIAPPPPPIPAPPPIAAS